MRLVHVEAAAEPFRRAGETDDPIGEAQRVALRLAAEEVVWLRSGVVEL
jgi:hypothetical protein